jgi:hypothetical protein
VELVDGVEVVVTLDVVTGAEVDTVGAAGKAPALVLSNASTRAWSEIQKAPLLGPSLASPTAFRIANRK